MNYLMLAASGEGIVRQLLILLVVIICALIIWAAGKWFIGVLKAPPQALTLIGHPIIKL